MTQSTVKKMRVDRIPGTETTVVDFDGVSFALDYERLVKLIADGAKALNGIHVNRSH